MPTKDQHRVRRCAGDEQALSVPKIYEDTKRYCILFFKSLH